MPSTNQSGKQPITGVERTNVSKLFKASFIHDRCYTGGKIVATQSILSNVPGSSHYGTIFALCDGDVTVVDGLTGTLVRTIRTGLRFSSHNNNNMLMKDDIQEDDFTGDTHDMDSILNFSLSPNNEILVTYSRNNLLRIYSIASFFIATMNKIVVGEEEHGILQTISKAHDCPVKAMEFHSSNAFMAAGFVDGVVKVWDMRGLYETKDVGYRVDINRCFLTHCFRNGCGIVGGVSTLSWAPIHEYDSEDRNKFIGSDIIINLAIGYENGKVDVFDIMKACTHKKKVKSLGVDMSNGKQEKTEKIKTSMEGAMSTSGMEAHVSTVTNVEWISLGNHTDLLVTASRDETLNIWSTIYTEQSEFTTKKKRRNTILSRATNYKRIYTKPIYESIESIQTAMPLSSDDNFFLITAGSKGKIRVWKIMLEKNSFLPKMKTSLERSNIYKHESIVIADMKCIYEQSITESHFAQGGYTKLFSFLSTNQNHSFALKTEKAKYATQVISVDAHHNISYHSLYEAPGTMCGDSDVEYDKSFQKTKNRFYLTLERTIVGYNDEIIDLKFLPTDINKHKPLLEMENDQSESNHIIKDGNNKIVVVTNSPLIQIYNYIFLTKQNCGEHAVEHASFVCESTLCGHTDIVLCVDVSPDGRLIASSGKDRTMMIWDVETGRCVATGTGHTEAIGAVALSQTLSRFTCSDTTLCPFALTASKDRTLKKWILPAGLHKASASSSMSKAAKTATPVHLSVSASVHAHLKDINVVTISPNDTLIATGSQDKNLKLWSSDDLTIQHTLIGHKRGVWDCQFSPIDRVIASSSGDKTIKLWSLLDGTCIKTFQGHNLGVLRVRFLSGGVQLVSSGGDGLIKLWTIRTGECESTLNGHTDKIWALDTKVEPGSKSSTSDFQNRALIVSGGADSKIMISLDVTKEEEDAKRDAREKNTKQEQNLQNFLRCNEFEKALTLALELGKPNMAFKVLSSIIGNRSTKIKDERHSPIQVLCRHVESWSLVKVQQVLTYCRDWNTRARNAFVSTLTVQAILRSIPISILCSEKLDGTKGKRNSIPELLAAMIPYTGRHFDRLDNLYENSFMFEFVLQCKDKVFQDDFDSDMSCLLPRKEQRKYHKDTLKTLKVNGDYNMFDKPMKSDGTLIECNRNVCILGDSDTSSQN